MNEIISKGYGKRDFDNFLDFWKKIKENSQRFKINQKIYFLINEIDKKLISFESKIILNDDERSIIIRPKISYDYVNSDIISKLRKESLKKELASNNIMKTFTFTEKINTNKKNEINNLENNSFILTEEKFGKNIFEINKNDQMIISFIDIDLFLQRIAQGKNIYDDPDTEHKLLIGICMQHTAFIKTDILINKIISCFNYFYEKYFEQENENKRDKTPIEFRINRARRLPYNHRPKNRNTFNERAPKIPYNIIYLLILFIDIHNKYSRETLNLDIIEKIQPFIKKLLSINEIKNKYENDLSSSSLILKQLKNSFTKRSIEKNNKIPFKNLFPSMLLKDMIISERTYFDILKTNSKEIAIELTNISYNIFSKIKPKELLQGVFTKKNKKELSPNIVEVTNRFNKLSFWAMEEILMYDKAKFRIQVVEKFIDIINELILLNNFFDSMSLSTALGQIIISSLNKTWKRISKKSKELYNKARTILNFADNYKLIKDKINECIIHKRPYIPFLSPYTKIICYMEEYGKYIKDKSLINADKIVIVQQILDQLFKFKLKQYDMFHITKNEFIILQYLDPLSEDELDKLASLLEPKFILYNKKHKEKRLSNTEKNFKINYEKNPDLV